MLLRSGSVPFIKTEARLSVWSNSAEAINPYPTAPSQDEELTPPPPVLPIFLWALVTPWDAGIPFMPHRFTTPWNPWSILQQTTLVWSSWLLLSISRDFSAYIKGKTLKTSGWGHAPWIFPLQKIKIDAIRGYPEVILLTEIKITDIMKLPADAFLLHLLTDFHFHLNWCHSHFHL